MTQQLTALATSAEDQASIPNSHYQLELQFWGIHLPLPASVGIVCAYTRTYMRTNTHTHKIKIEYFLK